MKHRMAGPENPFNPLNNAPAEHIVSDIITESPCKLDMSHVDTKKIPYSGKIGGHGQKIIENWKTAGRVTEFNWLEEQFKLAGQEKSYNKRQQPVTSHI